jgi:hypothetical protein
MFKNKYLNFDQNWNNFGRIFIEEVFPSEKATKIG